MKKLFIFFAFLLNANFAFGYITSNVSNGCYTNDTDLFGIFKLIEYTCANGYFLPADTLGCTACPTGYNCAGGTYDFSATVAQGITPKTMISENTNNTCSVNFTRANNNTADLFAKFIVNQYNCAPGYYLPAGTDWLTDNDGCTLCPNDSYCIGGTYTYNETSAQGITACSAGLFAPAGMWEPEQCGRILHVGDGFVYLRSTKKTEHALHVDLDHDGVADYFGNMTTLDVPMSRDTPRKLKVRWDNVTYSIYDDSVDLSLYE